MSEERLRLFVALVLPARIREALLRWREQALQSAAGLRLLDSDHLHITLCFLGWQAAEEAETIAGACQAVLSSAAAPHLVLGAPVWLPPRRPGVLAVELQDRGGGLAELQAALSRRLQEGGWYAPERRSYRGHVTVARVRRGAARRPGSLPGPPEMAFTAAGVTVFRSLLNPAGARYEALAQITIGS